MNIYETPKQCGNARNWKIIYYSFTQDCTGFSRHYERRDEILNSTEAYMHVMKRLISDKR